MYTEGGWGLLNRCLGTAEKDTAVFLFKRDGASNSISWHCHYQFYHLLISKLSTNSQVGKVDPAQLCALLLKDLSRGLKHRLAGETDNGRSKKSVCDETEDFLAQIV